MCECVIDTKKQNLIVDNFKHTFLNYTITRERERKKEINNKKKCN